LISATNLNLNVAKKTILRVRLYVPSIAPIREFQGEVTIEVGSLSSFTSRHAFGFFASRTPVIDLEGRLLQSWSRPASSLLRSRLAGGPAAVAPASRDVSRGRIHPPRLRHGLVNCPLLAGPQQAGEVMGVIRFPKSLTTPSSISAVTLKDTKTKRGASS
jgi:hypothetical protein